jgi:hypothetical protein
MHFSTIALVTRMHGERVLRKDHKNRVANEPFACIRCVALNKWRVFPSTKLNLEPVCHPAFSLYFEPWDYEFGSPYTGNGITECSSLTTKKLFFSTVWGF